MFFTFIKNWFLAKKICEYIGCKKQPRFGINKATHCKIHKIENMTDVVSRKCYKDGCNIITTEILISILF